MNDVRDAAPAADSRLRSARVRLRVRGPRQAVDLGTALVREHARVLYASWLWVALPSIAITLALEPAYRSLGLLLLWWVKPLCEHAVVLCLARELFGQRMGVRDTLAAFLRSLSWQSVAALTVRRFSPARALYAPIVLLEGARGRARRARMEVIGRGSARHAVAQNIVLLHVESYLAVSLAMLLVVLVPSAPEHYIDALRQWFANAMLPGYVIATIAIGPLHAAAGFALYIDRRCELEAWDVEVGFRRLAQRLHESDDYRSRVGLQSIAWVLLATALLASLPTERAQAATMDATGSARAAAAAATHDAGASATADVHAHDPRSEHADTPAARSREVMASVLAGDVFHQRDVVRYPAFLDDTSSAPDESSDFHLPEWLGAALRALVDAFWWVLWALVLACVAWVGWRYRTWIAGLFDRDAPRARIVAPAIVVAGVDLSAATHEDSLAAARALWHGGDARASLAMLLRMTLLDLVARGCTLRGGDTESDCLRAAAAVVDSRRVDYLRDLLACWLPLAYARRLPDSARIDALFEAFPERAA